jgi:hypothetical protein
MSEDHNPGTVRPGRYRGGNDAVELELRVDPELGFISGDLRQARLTAGGDDAAATYVASLRTEPGRALQLTSGTS